MKLCRLSVAAVALLLWAAMAQAQILIGQTVGVTGAVAATVKESNAGAMLYIDNVNAKGGIGGEKIELVTLDDKFDTKLTLANAKNLIEERHVVALFMTRGTPNTEGIIPLLDQYGVPLIGPSTGAMVLHTPLKKHVFNVRAPYQREAERAIAHLASLGMKRIAVVHVDDSNAFHAKRRQVGNGSLGFPLVRRPNVEHMFLQRRVQHHGAGGRPDQG